MPGELVGEAFIRITADTTPMRRAVKRAAKEAGSEYTSEFGKEVEATADARLRRARQRLADALVDPSGFDEMRKRFSSVEEAAGNFRGQLEQLRKQGDLNKREMATYNTAISNWEKTARKAEDAARALAKQEREDAEWRAREAEIIGKFEAGIKRVAAARKQEADLIERTMVAARKQVVEREKIAERETKAIEKAVLAQDRAYHSYAENIRVYTKRIEAESKGRATRGILAMSRALENFDDHLLKSGDRVGRVFGKGSRNNFFNAFGRTLEGITTGPLRLFGGALSGITGTVGKFSAAFTAARENGAGVFDSLFKATTSLGSAASNSLPGLIAIGVAVGALITLLPVAVSGLVLLGGAITAVAGAVTVGLLGGLLALGPALLAVVAAGVAAFGVYHRMTEEGTKAQEALKKVNRAWNDFYRGQTEGIDAVADAIGRNVPKILSAFKPLVDGALAGLETFIESFTVMLTGPEVRGALVSLGEALPKMLGTLGSAFGALTGGLLAFFDQIAPWTQRMLEGFDRLATRFLEWTTSAEGKNSIADFMSTAWTAANELWDLLGNVVEAIGKVFTAGSEGAGATTLGYLNDLVERFNTFLDSAEGQTAIQDFFADVKTFMVDAKNVLGDVIETFKNLDTEQAREDLDTLLQVIHDFTDALRVFSENADSFRISLELLGSPLIALVDIARTAYDKLFGHSYIPDIVKGFQTWMPKIPALITAALSGVFGFLTQPFQRAYTWVTQNVPKIATTVGTTLSALPGRVAGWLAALPARIGQPFSSALGVVSTRIGSIIATVRSRVGAIPGAVSSALSGLAGRFGSAFSGAWSTVSAWINTIRSAISGLLQRAQSVGSSIAGAFSGITRRFATGGVVYGPTRALIGEAGREAVVPLDRPLSMVDPSVRGLAAIAQGKTAFAGGGVAGGRQLVIEAGAIVIQTVSESPGIIAEMVIDRLASEARF